MIMAAKALVSSRVPLRRGFAVHAVGDEEDWGRGTTTLIEQGFYNGAECCIVGEPSNLSRLRNARRGTCLIDVVVTGKSTHGAQPEHGINAIAEAEGNQRPLQIARQDTCSHSGFQARTAEDLVMYPQNRGRLRRIKSPRQMCHSLGQTYSAWYYNARSTRRGQIISPTQLGQGYA